MRTLTRFRKYEHIGNEIVLKEGKWYWHDETEDEYGPYDRYDLAFTAFCRYCKMHLHSSERIMKFWRWWYKNNMAFIIGYILFVIIPLTLFVLTVLKCTGEY